MKIKYLVIRFSSIGDIVLTTPVVRCLKQQVEGAEVHFVTKKKHATIVASNPFVDKVHVFTKNLSELFNNLEEEKFDYIIDLHQNLRSNRIKSRLKIPAFSFQKLNFQKYLLVRLKINRMPDKHIVERYLETVSVFDVENDGKGLDFFIPENENFDTSELPDKFQKGYIAFVIAGTYPTKKLPPEKIIEICNGIEFPVILLGGKDEQEVAKKIVEKTGENVFNLTGKINLNQSASLVKNARLVLANDTGLMHIAAAFKKKILSFWGNTVPEFGMVPYQADPASEIMEVTDLKCRPCSKLGYSKCPKKHFKCMKNLDSLKVAEWINRNFNA
jgi:ADP-heptose:LPS heptosyltransferase